MTEYRVRVWREPDGMWSAQAIDVPEAVTTGHSLAETERHAKEALAVALDLPRSAESEMRLLLEITVDDGGPLDQSAQAAVAARAAAHEAASAVRQAVVALSGQGISSRDVARLTGISPGRVSQILAGRSPAVV